MSLAHLAPIFTQYITCVSVCIETACGGARVSINTIENHIQLHTTKPHLIKKIAPKNRINKFLLKFRKCSTHTHTHT